jgi:FecR protein
MCRPLCTLGLAILFMMISSSSARAQFARVPQEYSAGQPSSVPYGPSTPDETTADTANDRQHGAARISVVQGDVNVRRGDTSELVAAAVNAPLVAQDRLQTSEGSRAEIELDSASLIRLAPDTDIGLADMEYRRFQVQLGAGTIIYRVLRSPDSQGEVDTPNIALRALGEGVFRIAVLSDGTSQIDVSAGSAEILGPRGSQRIDAGHSVVVRGDPADPEFLEIPASMRDQFDDWSEARDRELLSSQSYTYVSRDINGAEDLDTNGTWVPSQYGQVWAPRVTEENWAPYSYGQWSWEPYYGWTWIDYAPWGWAPYHYGRWFWNGGYGWCWWPGARLSAQLWRPALVGFFGWSNGALGWTALAPYERLQPWWRRGSWGGGPRPYGPGSFYGLRNAGVWNAYRNTAFRGGAVFAAYNGFGGPQQRFGFATREQLGNASFVQGQVPIGPNRASYLFTNRQAVANPRFSSVSNRRFFQYRQPPFGGGGQRVGADVWLRGGVGSTQNRPAGGLQTGESRQLPQTVPGWQRFGDPGRGNGYRQGFAGGNGESGSGWHQFGRPQDTHSINQERRWSGNSGGYNGPHGNYGGSSYGGSSAPRYNATPQRYGAPPQARSSGGSFHGGSISPRGGGGHYSAGDSRRRGR